ncbi:MAG TPA: hypothetical protein VIT38_07905 [Allosphingosinicella sp.]|jgi:hypothetical protein
MDRKRSQGPATDAQGKGQIGDVLRATFGAPDIGESDDEMTRLLLHLSHEPIAPAPKKAAKAVSEPAKRRGWLRRKRPS